MIGMFAFMGMMFSTCALTFLIMKDDERSIPYVLLNLYQALLLADGNGAEAIQLCIVLYSVLQCVMLYYFDYSI